MPHGFDMYRIFVSAPGDLERDRETCHDAIAQANETTAMPAKVLLVTVGLRDNDQISGSRAIVSDNVRWSAFFIQIFEDDWGPRDLFRKLFLLAVECRDDATMPMREVVVYLKDAPNEPNPEILAFRKELEDRQDLRVFRYRQADELRGQLAYVCNEWALIGPGTHSPMATGT
jgi:endo-1,4-beta-D-glucanase Y